MTALISVFIWISLLFVYIKMPLTLALLIISQTILISLLSFIAFKSPWFSFILLMLFISGMMIIFVYVSSLASNEYTTMKINYISLPLILVPLIFIAFINKPSNNMDLNNLISLTTSQFNLTSFINYKIYTEPMMYLTLMLIIYLLLALVVVVKITSHTKGPLRMKK